MFVLVLATSHLRSTLSPHSPSCGWRQSVVRSVDLDQHRLIMWYCCTLWRKCSISVQCTNKDQPPHAPLVAGRGSTCSAPEFDSHVHTCRKAANQGSVRLFSHVSARQIPSPDQNSKCREVERNKTRHMYVGCSWRRLLYSTSFAYFTLSKRDSLRVKRGCSCRIMCWCTWDDKCAKMAD